jgi:hypothetical protein
MKYILILIGVFSLGLTNPNPSLNDLDLKYGFKTLKFNTTIASFGNQIKLIPRKEGSRASKKIIQYEYTGECCKEIYNQKIIGIALDFYNKKLICIEVILSIDKTQYSVKSLIETSFGAPTEIDNIGGCLWEAKKVILRYDETSEGMGMMVFTEKQLMEKANLDEF